MRTLRHRLSAVLAVLTLTGVIDGLAIDGTGSARFHDDEDLGCATQEEAFPKASLNATGGNRAGCPPCTGMPAWWVSSPYINLWIADEPLSYRLSTGDWMTFRWSYRQRYQIPSQSSYYLRGIEDPAPVGSVLPFLFGRDSGYYSYMRRPGMTNATWSQNWFSDILFWDLRWETNHYGPVFSSGYEAIWYQPDGGMEYVPRNPPIGNGKGFDLLPLSALNYPTEGFIPPDTNGIYWGETSTNGLKVVYSDGSVDRFGLCWKLGLSDSTCRAWLTERIDPQGRVTRIGYEAGNGGLVYRPRYVVDIDGRTNTFRYNEGTNWELSEVEDPYERKARVLFDPAEHRLSAIVDAAGLTTSFVYEPGHMLGSVYTGSGWITNLTTPYGETTFRYYQEQEAGAISEYKARAVLVTEPGNVRQLFYYRHRSDGLMDATATAPQVTGHVFDSGSASTELRKLYYRNSFHWDRRQFANLSVSNWNYFALTLSSLNAADYRKATLQHWLLGADGISITDALSSYREPSPDPQGGTEGARIWYDYAWKESATPHILPYLLEPQINCVARTLPGNAVQFVETDYWNNLPLEVRESYTKPDGSAGVRTNSFVYAGHQPDLVGITNAGGIPVRLGYNSYHQVTKVTNALDHVTTLQWSTASKHLERIDGPAGQSLVFARHTGPWYKFIHSATWQPQGLVLEIADYQYGLPRVVRLGGTGLLDLWMTNTWDGLNRLTGTTFADGTSVSNAYHRLDLAAVKDRLGHWTRFGYDAFQNLTRITNALENVTSLSWCACGGLESLTDALTNTTTFFYDNQGRLVQTVYPDTTTVTNGYDSAGRLVRVADIFNRGFNLGYNHQGLLTVVSNAFGVAGRVTYDNLDRPWVLTSAENVTVTNQFDALNRVTRRVWQDGLGEGFRYSTNGLLAYTNRNSKETWFCRDAAGRLRGVTNANGEVTRVAYNGRGQVTDLWDGRTNHTVWRYDANGWVTSKVDALGREVARHTRDANGQLRYSWTPQFGETAYYRDAAGNLTNVVYPLGSGTAPVSFEYDKLDRLRGMTDALGTTVFGWTAAGRFASEDGPWAGDAVSHSYQQGLRTAMNLNAQPEALNWAYDFDNAFRLGTVQSPAGAFGYGYGGLPSSLVRTLSLPNGGSVSNHFDSLARLDFTALKNRWGHVLDGAAYVHDPAGLRTNLTRYLGLSTNSVAAGYDSIGQLTRWSAREPSGALRHNEQLGFKYDPGSNLSHRTNGALVQTFVNDPLNQLTNITRTGTLTVSGATPAPATAVTVNGLAAERYGDFTFARTNVTLLSGQNTFTNIAQNAYGLRVTNVVSVNLSAAVTLKFDSNGNLTNDGTRSFFYDAENQLTNVAVAGQWKSEFVFDGLGRRRITREYGWQGGGWGQTNEVRYVYDRMLALQERDATNGVQVTYTRGLDLSGGFQGAGGIGGLLARTDAQGSTFYHADGAGNVTALMDAQEGIAARYLYNPFGRLTGKWGSMAEANRYRFSSKEVHAASGLSYYGFRFYDAGLQRWLNPDPLGEAGGINLFGFVSNNPLTRIDPFGESDENRPPVVVFPPGSGLLPLFGPPALEPNIRQGVPNPLDLLEAIAADQHQGNLAIADLLLSSPLGGLIRWPGDSDEEARDSLADAIDKALATMGNVKCMPKTGAGFAAESGAANRATFEAYKDSLRAQMSRPTASNPELNSLLDKLYRPNAQVGSGSTAAAVRQELATGQPVGGAFHSQKAQESITALQRWLNNNPTAAGADRAAAENVIRDMQNALSGH